MRQPKLDCKFFGKIFKAKDNSEVPDDQYVVFLVNDNAFAAVLPEYLQACIRMGADDEQTDGVRRLIERVTDWRAKHLDKLKVPDASGEKMLQP